MLKRLSFALLLLLICTTFNAITADSVANYNNDLPGPKSSYQSLINFVRVLKKEKGGQQKKTEQPKKPKSTKEPKEPKKTKQPKMLRNLKKDRGQNEPKSTKMPKVKERMVAKMPNRMLRRQLKKVNKMKGTKEAKEAKEAKSTKRPKQTKKPMI